MKAPNGTASQTATATHSSGNDDTAQTDITTPQDSEALAGDHIALYEGFDAAIHAVDKDGKPTPKKGGGWQKKRGGNMRGAQAAPASPGARAPAPVAKVDTMQAARAVCNSIVAALVLVFGDQWAPRDKTEADALSGAVKNYFDAKGAVEVSPGMALTLVILAYSVPRVQHEATVSKLSKIRASLANGFAWLRGRWSK